MTISMRPCCRYFSERWLGLDVFCCLACGARRTALIFERLGGLR